jgi:hypothetical protein
MENINIRDYRSEDYLAITDLWLKTGLGGPHRGDNQKVIEKSIFKKFNPFQGCRKMENFSRLFFFHGFHPRLLYHQEL